MSNWKLPQLGFPIRTPPDQSLLTAPRGSFVVRHVLHRLLAPRHPPCALSSLTIRSCSSCHFPCFACAKPKVVPFRSLTPAVYLIKHFTCLHKISLKECSNSHLLSFRYLVFKEQAYKILLVEPSGIEPLTSCLQGRRSPS